MEDWSIETTQEMSAVITVMSNKWLLSQVNSNGTRTKSSWHTAGHSSSKHSTWTKYSSAHWQFRYHSTSNRRITVSVFLLLIKILNWRSHAEVSIQWRVTHIYDQWILNIYFDNYFSSIICFSIFSTQSCSYKINDRVYWPQIKVRVHSQMILN